MVRPLRIAVSDGIYHVIARGNGRQPIYAEDRDNESFLDLLEEVLLRFGWRCITYCLMGNHYHLVVRTTRPNLSQGMRQLNGVYAQRFNRRHNTCGHLFQGRFLCALVDKENYLCELARYVALNPVRAGICSVPEAWPWSAHRVLIGIAEGRLVNANDLLEFFGSSLPQARKNYHRFVQEGDGTWSPNERGPAIGSSEFLDAHLPDARPSPEISRKPWRENRPPLDHIFDQHPQEAAIELAYTEFGYRLREIAAVLGCHYSTISRRLRALEERCRETQREQ